MLLKQARLARAVSSRMLSRLLDYCRLLTVYIGMNTQLIWNPSRRDYFFDSKIVIPGIMVSASNIQYLLTTTS